MHKSIFLLLLLLVLLTARTEMNRPQDPVRKRPGKAISIKATPEIHSGRGYDLNSNLSMRTPKNRRQVPD
jgi:hypothetical protein